MIINLMFGNIIFVNNKNIGMVNGFISNVPAVKPNVMDTLAIKSAK